MIRWKTQVGLLALLGSVAVLRAGPAAADECAKIGNCHVCDEGAGKVIKGKYTLTAPARIVYDKTGMPIVGYVYDLPRIFGHLSSESRLYRNNPASQWKHAILATMWGWCGGDRASRLKVLNENFAHLSHKFVEFYDLPSSMPPDVFLNGSVAARYQSGYVNERKTCLLSLANQVLRAYDQNHLFDDVVIHTMTLGGSFTAYRRGGDGSEGFQGTLGFGGDAQSGTCYATSFSMRRGYDGEGEVLLDIADPVAN
jgi:hypothetical protein